MIKDLGLHEIEENEFKVLDELIYESVSVCPECGAKLVGMECCFSASPMLCRSCLAMDHLAHRTNSLFMLFYDHTLDTDSAELIKQLEATKTMIIVQKEEACHLIEIAERPHSDLVQCRSLISALIKELRRYGQLWKIVVESLNKRIPAFFDARNNSSPTNRRQYTVYFANTLSKG